MSLHISDLDKCFLDAFENATLDIKAFHHREHVRLAYIELTLNDVHTAYRKIRSGLLRLLDHNGIDRQQYHDTLTFAWVQAVRHFMYLTDRSVSADDFIAQNTVVLDKSVMYTHYSYELIKQEHARVAYVPPDLQPIPLHG
ncbi:hypothetical protein [Teredinibacter purpureus]|uniref:hypothetical protein n=1 Tax=Teredinibacter purpureus TaxID=2731756 RepID=UPI0005F7C917|nr:hypothetical protein [Teredinibacter purpureus]